MATDRAELLSAFMDREPVDSDALAAALEDPDARRALVAFARLRQELHAPIAGESEWLAAHPPRPLPAAPPRWWRAAAAAALLAAGIGAGVLAERYGSRAGPPEPTRIVQLEPVSVSR